MLEGLIERIGELPAPLFLLVVALLAYSETVLFLDLLVPGEVGMVLAGAAAVEAGIPLAAAIAAGVVGAVLGDSTSYWLGRTIGPGIVHRFRWTRRRVEPEMERARRYFERSGGLAILGGRFVGALRAVVPFIAGAGQMAYGRFLAWNVVASVAWVGLVITLGHQFGDDIAAGVDRVGVVVSVVAVIAIVAVWRLRTARRSKT